MKRRAFFYLICISVLLSVLPAYAQRRITPIATAATTTQAVNETAADTARINAKRRAQSISYVDDRGRTIFVDTITGKEWTDSTALKKSRVPKMEYPLLYRLNVAVNLWDPIMRLTGQKYGITDMRVELSMHNRYIPVFEVGLGLANYTPDDGNYNYRSLLSVFYRIGADYNFLYNSDPDYQVVAGLRYGIAPFSYQVDNVVLNDSYWGETSVFNVPRQHATVGWLEVNAGVRVRLVGPLSAGWNIKYQYKLHQSKDTYGKPWYVPGYGTYDLTASVSLIYSFGIEHLNKKPHADVVDIEDKNNEIQ